MLLYILGLEGFIGGFIRPLDDLGLGDEVFLLFLEIQDGLLVVLFEDKEDGKDWAHIELRFDAYFPAEKLADAFADTKPQPDAVGVHLIGGLKLPK